MSGGFGREAAAAEEGGGAGGAAAKGGVQFHGVFGVAGGEEGFEAGGGWGVERVFCFEEGVEAVGIEDLGPEVGVVAGGVAAAGEDVLEVGRAVAEADFVGHADLGEVLGFETFDVDRGRVGMLMEGHVDEGGGCVFDGGEALVEASGGQDGGDLGVGQGGGGLMVAGVGGEGLGEGDPVFVDLGGEFHEVTADGSPGLGGVADVAQEAVQGVAEFMEEGFGVVEAEEGGIGL